ncbi:MAG: M1 family aminopeptidase [Longimicrobiales bacterium]
MRTRRFWSLRLGCIPLIGVFLGFTPDTYPKNHNVDALNYAFELTLSDETDEIVGRATMDVRFKADGETALRLDLISASGATGMVVSSASVDGTPVDFAHEAGVLTIPLVTPSTKGQRVAVVVDYRGAPETGLIIGPNKHGDRTFFSDNWPNRARHWLPTIDHPYDKATCEFIITAPDNYQVVSNGLLIEETDLDGDLRLTHWKQSVPIATWLYVLGVAEFAVQRVGDYQGKEIQTWVYKQDRDAGFYDFAVPTKQALEFYGEYVGPYQYEKLANIQSNSVGGGMEAASAVFYSDESVTGERTERWRNVVIHEIAHQWFGNAVTESDWDDIWLSEGFATYFTLLFIEHAYGRDAFLEGLASSRERILAFNAERPDYTIVHDNLSDMSQVTTGQIYQKGAWTLHMLRGVMGDDAFWRGIRSYYAEFVNENATTADFQRVMEETSGLELTGFFQQWLHQGGAPRLEGEWEYNAATGAVSLTLTQTQDATRAFSFPLEVEVVSAAGERSRHEINVDPTGASISLPVSGPPVEVVLDPDQWVLMEAQLAQAPS